MTDKRAIEVDASTRLVLSADGSVVYEERSMDAMGAERWVDICPRADTEIAWLTAALVELAFSAEGGDGPRSPDESADRCVGMHDYRDNCAHFSEGECAAEGTAYLAMPWVSGWCPGYDVAAKGAEGGWRADPLPEGVVGDRIDVEWSDGLVNGYEFCGERWLPLGRKLSCAWKPGTACCSDMLRWRYPPPEQPKPTKRGSIQAQALAAVTDESRHVSQIARDCGLKDSQVSDALKVQVGKTVERTKRGYYRLLDATDCRQCTIEVVGCTPPEDSARCEGFRLRPEQPSLLSSDATGLDAYLDDEQKAYWKRQFTLLNEELVDSKRAARLAWGRVRARWPETQTKTGERK